MAYKQKNYFEFRDSLASGEPDKIIKGLHFDEEFGAIEKAFENVTGDILVEEIEGLADLLDDKVSKTDTNKQSVQSELEIKNELVVKGNQDPDAFPTADSPAYLSVNPEDRKALFSPYYPQVGGDAAEGWEVELAGTLELSTRSFPPRYMTHTTEGMFKNTESYVKWQDEIKDSPIADDQDAGWVIKPNLFVDQNISAGGDINVDGSLNVEGSINVDGNIIGGENGIDIGKEISDLNDDLLQEIQDRKDADKVLQDQIDDLDTGKADLSALNQEIKDREQGDKAINDRIDNLKVNDLADTKAQSPNRDDFLIYDGTDWVAEKFHIDTELQFKGGISVPNDPAPAAEHGDLYINNEEGIAGASWTGIAGKQINPANAVGWSSTNNRWYMLGDIATSAVTEIREGTAIKVDASVNPSTPTVSLDKALTNSWYAHQVTSKTDSGINVSVSVDSEGYVSYDVSADIRELGEDFAPADKAYMYTDQANICTADFTIDCQKTTITNQTVTSGTIEGEYFNARLDDSFLSIQNTFAFTNRSGNALFIDGTGEGITAPKIKKIGGTAEQLLCADGSVATKTEVGGTYQLPVGKSGNNSLRWGVNGWEASELLTINDTSSQVWVAGNLAVNLELSAFKIVKSGGTANQLLCADGSVVDKSSVGSDTDLTNYYTKAEANSTFDKYGSWRWQTSDSSGNVSATTDVASNGLINFEAGPNMTIYKSSNNVIHFDALPFGDATNYYTKTEADNKFQLKGSYLTSADLNGYATQTWVTNQNYLTSASLNGYATESWVTTNHYKKTETKKNVVMTEAAYNSLGSKDAETVYFLT